MGKEKEFNNILDECLDRLMFKGDTVELCLADYPEYADELRPLLETSLMTSKISSLEPDQEFKAKSRNELFAILREAEEKKSRSLFKFSWQPRWAGVVAIIVAILIATGGTSAASIGSMPDDFLYPVKRATEHVQLAFTFTNLGKAEAYARMANRRVEEIIYLANENDTDEIELLATSLDSNLNNIAEYSSREDNVDKTASDEGALMFSEKAAVIQESEEADIEQSLTVTAGGTPASDEGIVSEESVDEETAPAPVAAESTEPEVNTELPPARIILEPETSGQWLSKREELNVTVINQANINIQRLYELLDTVPESTREVILKAIEISERGYGIAIDSLFIK
ncbi:MAG: hypothetical protein JSU58_09105 [Dehalococcoidales bacterium]|nr:MAG: hypothetical protein JSU58_09105 [Dehalococcoidales bacterium]